MPRSRTRAPGRPSAPLERNALLAAARRVFAARGYAGARLDDIAEALDIRRSSLLHHARSKRALYLETLEAIATELGDLVAAASQPTADFVTRLDRLSTLVTEYLAAHPNAARLALRELTGPGPYATGPGKDRIRSAVAAVGALLEDAMHRGELPPGEPAQLAMSIIGLHLLPFGCPLVPDALGASPKGRPERRPEAEAHPLAHPETAAARARAVRAQVRALLGLPPPPSDAGAR